MCPNIRCDRWKRKYFGFAWELNRPKVTKISKYHCGLTQRSSTFWQIILFSYERIFSEL
jgi:hypothetical protein